MYQFMEYKSKRKLNPRSLRVRLGPFESISLDIPFGVILDTFDEYILDDSPVYLITEFRGAEEPRISALEEFPAELFDEQAKHTNLLSLLKKSLCIAFQEQNSIKYHPNLKELNESYLNLKPDIYYGKTLQQHSTISTERQLREEPVPLVYNWDEKIWGQIYDSKKSSLV